MKPNVMSVVTPLSMAEATVLQAYATRAVPAELPPDRRLEWAKTTQALTARGALQKTPEGIGGDAGGARGVTGRGGYRDHWNGISIWGAFGGLPGCCQTPEYRRAYVGGTVRTASPSTELNDVIG